MNGSKDLVQRNNVWSLSPLLSESGPKLVDLWKAQMAWCAEVTPVLEHLQKPASPIQEVLGRLDRLRNLHQDWDSYGSDAPTSLAVAIARHLIWIVLTRTYALAEDRSIPYAVVPLSGGGVQVEWRCGAKAIEVEIGPDGHFGYLLVEGSGTQRRFDERDGIDESAIVNLVISVVL